ncbi:hypothetical protein C5167_049571 [Papaver somniferum]|uniref:Uncharacterized protein n=1 Tax=Papaver somniferum TaxID=3469 RepID=A0A4Y7KPP4_PAPSO|nr:hypothetical protein C5167_049571 [Papaver somniferum]
MLCAEKGGSWFLWLAARIRNGSRLWLKGQANGVTANEMSSNCNCREEKNENATVTEVVVLLCYYNGLASVVRWLEDLAAMEIEDEKKA